MKGGTFDFSKDVGDKPISPLNLSLSMSEASSTARNDMFSMQERGSGLKHTVS